MTGENAPVREVPGFARVGQAARRAFLGLTTPLFGTPGEPTKLGKAMDLVDEAASVGLMTYGASAARLGRAAERASLVARGARPQTVLRRTGYQRGPFGYGVETRGDAYFRPSVLFDGGEGVVGRLGDVADVHPDVATAYPGVERDVAVRLVPDSEWAARVAEARGRISAWSRGETSRGFFDRSGMEVNVRGKMPSETLEMYMDRADKTLSHELQHAAHEMDGIPPPKRGNFEWYRTDAREVDARNSANRNLLTPEERVEMPRANTQDVRPSEVHLADRGGDINGRHGNFTNFLATDDVPESIFGIPVVQDEGGYTESDLRFFKENPKAAGFYDMGDEEDVESQEAWGGGDADEAEGATKVPFSIHDKVLRVLSSDASDTEPAANEKAARATGSMFVPGLAGMATVGWLGGGAGAVTAAAAGTALLGVDVLNPAVNDLTREEMAKELYKIRHAGLQFKSRTIGPDGTVGYESLFNDRGEPDVSDMNVKWNDPFRYNSFANVAGTGETGAIGYRKTQIGDVGYDFLDPSMDPFNGGGNLGHRFRQSKTYRTRAGIFLPAVFGGTSGDVRNFDGVRKPGSVADAFLRLLETKKERALRELVDQEAYSLALSRDTKTGPYDLHRFHKAFLADAARAYMALSDEELAKMKDDYYRRRPPDVRVADDILERQELQRLRKQSENSGLEPVPKWFLKQHRWKVPKDMLETDNLEELDRKKPNGERSEPSALRDAVDRMLGSVFGGVARPSGAGMVSKSGSGSGAGGAGASASGDAGAPASGVSSSKSGDDGSGLQVLPRQKTGGGGDPFDRGRKGRAGRNLEPLPESVKKDAIRATRQANGAGDTADNLYEAFYGNDAPEVVADILAARRTVNRRPLAFDGDNPVHPQGVPVSTLSPWASDKTGGLWRWSSGGYRDVWEAPEEYSVPRKASGNYDIAAAPEGSRPYVLSHVFRPDGSVVNPLIVLPKELYDKQVAHSPNVPKGDEAKHEFAHPGNFTDLRETPTGEDFKNMIDNSPYLGPGVYGPGGVRLFNYHWSQPNEFTAAYANLRRAMAARGTPISGRFDDFVVDNFGDLMPSKGRRPHIVNAGDVDYAPADDIFGLTNAIRERVRELGIPKSDAGDLVEQYILIRELDPEKTIKRLRENPELKLRYGDRMDKLIRAFGTPEERREVWRHMQEIVQPWFLDQIGKAGGPRGAVESMADAKGGTTRGRYPGVSNNPGNVEKHERRTDKTLFEGEDGGGVRPKRFARFTDPVLGLKASATVLARKADELAKAGKPFTIENYAPLYAPRSENDTDAYIKNLSKYSGIARNVEISRWDTDSLAKLLKAKVRFETGLEASRWFTDEEYEEAAEKLQEGVFD